MGHLTTPTGRRIVATVETIPGTCIIADVGRLCGSDVNLIEHAGGTDVDWDNQQTLTIMGQRVFMDESGENWLEHQLTYVDED